MTAPALATRGLCKTFGGIAATQDVTLSLARGARQALIGPNGAGKTTLVNLLTGLLAPSAGAIELDGVDVTTMPTHRRARLGLMRTFQINQLFTRFTPLETLTLVCAQRAGAGGHMLRALGRHMTAVDEAAAVLAQFHLSGDMHRTVRELPYGKRRLLEIAVAVAGRPRVLLLDEPLAGVPAGESGEILDTLAALPPDVCVLLIEHDMDLVFRFASRISVMVNGTLLVEGSADAIARNPEVRAVYLGGVSRG